METKIQELRKANKISQAELADEMDDTEIQAVNNRKSGILQIVFFKPA